MEVAAPRDRLFLAVEALAASAEPIQRRLAEAGLHLITVLPGEFGDPDHREQFISITDALCRVDPVGDEGSLEVTTASLSDDEAVAIAHQIVALDVDCRPLTPS